MSARDAARARRLRRCGGSRVRVGARVRVGGGAAAAGAEVARHVGRGARPDIGRSRRAGGADRVARRRRAARRGRPVVRSPPRSVLARGGAGGRAAAAARRRRSALGRRRLGPVRGVPREPHRRRAGVAAGGAAAGAASAGGALRGAPLATSIELSPLSSEATAAVVAEHGGAPVSASFAQACHGATGGNPLLVHRLAEGLRDRGIAGAGDADAEAVTRLGPYAVAGAVGAALARLGEGPVRLAHAVAVLERAPLVTAARLAGVGSEQAVGVRRAARARRDPARRPPARVRARAGARRGAERADGGRARAAARGRGAHPRRGGSCA